MASSLLAMDNSSRRDISGSVNWGRQQQQHQEQRTVSLDNLEIPKFRSFAPSSLSISPYSPVSPSTFSPSTFLDSAAFISSSYNILDSPTTGPLISNDGNQKGTIDEEPNFFDFSFETQSEPSSTATATTSSSSSSLPIFPSSNFVSVEQQRKKQQEQWNSMKPNIPNDFSSEKQEEKSELGAQSQNNSGPSIQSGSYQYAREQRGAEDGYNWRKYGEKQVKESENPRSYYKCTYPNCPTRKKVERSLDGQITEIVYTNKHNHPKPQSTGRSSSSQSIQPLRFSNFDVFDNNSSNSNFNQTDSSTTQEDNTLGLLGDEELEQGSPAFSNLEEDCRGEPEAKRWQGDNETDGVIGTRTRTVRAPRIIVQTISDIDILDDGYRWRKYGQKVVKGNPNPKSYYKCTTIGCPVRKHVERASHDIRAVNTTYEGRHNHDVPAAQGSGNAMNRPQPDSTDGGNSMAPIPIRPAAISGGSNYTSSSQAPYTLQMLQNPNVGSFGYQMNNDNNQTQHNFVGFSRAKESPSDDSFFDVFLSERF